MSSKIIGRVEVYDKIKKRLTYSDENLSITSIGGHGGIGKSYLLNKLLDEIRLEDNGYLVLKIDGSKNDVSFEKYITQDLISSASTMFPVTKGYFNETSKSIREWENLEIIRKKKFIKKGEADLKFDGKILSDCFELLQQIGEFADKNFKNQKRLKFKGLNNIDAQKIIDLYNNVKVKVDSNPFEGRLPDITGRRTLRYNLQNDFNQTVATALVNDISYIFQEASNISDKRKFKPGPGKTAKSFKDLAIIIDDYEYYQDMLNKFFISSFIPEAKKRNFKVMLILVGRDLLLDTTQEWDRYVGNIADFELIQFNREESIEYLNSVNIFDDDVIERLINDTEGTPYLLYLEAMSFRDGGKLSAHKLKLYFDRITKWMREDEKYWFERLCFLRIINVDSIRDIMPEEDADNIYKWFINEASIRDTKSEQYRIRPFISSKVKDYICNESPEKYNNLINKSNEINSQ